MSGWAEMQVLSPSLLEDPAALEALTGLMRERAASAGFTGDPAVSTAVGWLDPDDEEAIPLPMQFAPEGAEPNIARLVLSWPAP